MSAQTDFMDRWMPKGELGTDPYAVLRTLMDWAYDLTQTQHDGGRERLNLMYDNGYRGELGAILTAVVRPDVFLDILLMAASVAKAKWTPIVPVHD